MPRIGLNRVNLVMIRYVFKISLVTLDYVQAQAKLLRRFYGPLTVGDPSKTPRTSLDGQRLPPKLILAKG